ncbi:RagB/SusD family nutrient uptake outer membrane protein [Flavobacterium hydrophilum]|uniref:RagB/SusD family nutrient uptake outer membrane protein n=1 Tax=Flavobacterium hydrophilum TaxID=2211445 RepID=A0A2V4C5W3_9FLAO|nr:RagB/SusD family nutrient uptake outer membrane protein [Flavobacterium hydrophilum]PXY46728.1 RagB/SusD family nutrient uptake outer membrane protein [Flavobacterium hydrophilum]
MNKKILLSALFSFALCFTACDDYLDVHPATGFTEAEVFSSESEVQSALAGVYTLMLTDDAYSNRLAFVFNPNTDVEMAAVNTTAVNVNGSDIACYEPKPYWTTLNSTWNTMYKIINNANDVIAGIEGSDLYKTASKTEPSKITQMYGEAKTIRAMIYLDMIRIWGDVIFRTKSSTGDEDFRVGVTDRNKILEFLIDDLKSVEPLMQYASVVEYGTERATRSFNQGLIGLLALTRGGWTLRPDSDPSSIGHMVRGENHELYYDIAIQYLGKVINEGQHDLKLSYRDFWITQNKLVTPDNDDVMFSLPLLKSVSGEYGYAIGIPIVEGSHNYGSASGSLNLAGTYLFSFDSKDLRRDITCAPYSYDATLKQVIRLDLAKLAVGKWSKLYGDPQGSTSQKGTGVNYSWMRFADVLLMYAEAVNERFGPRQDAQEALKRVRRRAFSPADWATKVDSYVSSKSNPDLFFQAIMDERAWELGGESKRKFDLARWNKYSEVIYNQYNKFVNWGKVANGAYVPGVDNVPGSVYWKEIPNPDANNPSKTILDIKGIDPVLQAKPAGYTETVFATKWYALNNDTQAYEPNNDVKWSFRGFINFNNASSVSPTAPLRYLCPYPAKVISDHRGAIQNYYGFNY